MRIPKPIIQEEKDSKQGLEKDLEKGLKQGLEKNSKKKSEQGSELNSENNNVGNGSPRVNLGVRSPSFGAKGPSFV